MKKRLLSMLLVICMVVSLLPVMSLTAFAAAGDVPTTMSVEPTADNNIPAAINLYKTSTSGGGWNPGGGGGWGWNPGGGGGTTSSTNTFDLFLPGNANVSKCFLSWADGLEATYNGKTYASGTLPIPAPGSKGTVTFTKGSATTTFEITTYQGSANIPATFIVIDESQGTISAMNNDQKHNTECVGVMYVDGELFEMPKIKGRGNYTWTSAVQKKSYNITLAKKTNLLGIECDATKKWSILGNIDDHSLIRDQLAYGMAYDMGIGLDNAQTDIWMNGEYQGTYLMTPKYDSFVSDDGYLLEHDNKTEDSVEKGGDPQFTLNGLNDRISVKKVGANLLGEETPENLKAARDEIKNYMSDVWEAMNASNGKNSKGKYYADYLDMDSWAKFWLMQEYIKDYDIAAGSKMFSREGTAETDLLYAGPLWDCGNALGRTQNNPALGSAADETNGYGWYIQKVNGTSLYKSLAKHDDFMELVYKVYTRNKKVFDEAPAKVAQFAKDIEASAAMNFVKVTRETYETCNVGRDMTKEAGTAYEQHIKKTSSWSDYVNNLSEFVTARSKFFADNMTVEGELDPGYRATFKVGKNAAVTVYDTQDTTTGGTQNLDNIFAKNSATGEIDMSGEGQVNFKVEMKDGYSLVGVTAEPAENFKNLKGSAETGADNVYRLTKVTGPVIINVETAEVVCNHVFDKNGKCTLCGVEAFKATFDCDAHCSVTAYLTQDLTTGGTPNVKTAFARASTDGSIDISGEGQIGFIVNLEEGYEVANITAEPANYKNFKRPDETGTPDYYRLTKVRGDVTVTIKTKVQGADENIDFTKAADAGKYEILSQKNAKVTEGTGLKLTATRPAFEDCNGQNTGDNGKNPEDVIAVPVSGDWTATLSFDFSTGAASNGYYQFFGFYAGQGEGYQNLAGIRGGDGAMQDFLRKDGTVTAEKKNSTPGLSSNGTYWYQIKKEGTTYTCLRSADGENFTEMFSYADTGIEADSIYIDAYTGMTEGYEFTLKSLNIEGKGGNTPVDPIDPIEEEPFVATFVCDEHCSITAYDTQALENGHEKATSAEARNSATGEIDISGDGQVNFVVVPDAGYEVESVVAEPANYKNLKKPDETGVENGYRITKVTGNFTVTVITKKTEVTPIIEGHYIDFTKASDASKYEIDFKASAAVTEGEGLKFSSSTANFEATGDPSDVIKIPMSGNWVATFKFTAVPGSTFSFGGDSDLLGIYVMDDYQNGVGMRAGNSSIVNFVRKNGVVTTDTAAYGTAIGAGFTTNATNWFRIEKAGADVICYVSTDGEDFTEAFVIDNTGLEGKMLVIDAYKNTSWSFGVNNAYTFEYMDLVPITGPIVKPEIKSISVDGKKIDFDPAVKAYNVEVSKDATKAPVITVEAGNTSTKIDIQQLTGPFGTAYVTASAGTRALKYSLSFNYGPQDDYFADGDMSDNWSILHEVKDATEERPWTYYRFEEGTGLVLPTQKGSIYMAKQADPQGPWTNVFVMPAQGDWEIVTKSFYPQLPKDIYQQTQVFAWQDEDNYIRINCQYNAQQNLRVEPAAEIGSGTFNILDVTYANPNADGTATLYYKVKKEGSTYTVSYSTDCKNWVAGGKVENLNYIDPKFGLFCTQDDGNDNYIELAFEYVAVTSRNGKVVRTDAQVLEWGAQQAADYMVKSLPAVTTEKLSVKAPHGYNVEFVSSNAGVIAADGTVTPGKATADVQVSVKVTEGDTTATSAPVTIKVTGTESGECAHNYTKVVAPATCTADGYTTYSCSKCGDTYKADEVKALGHDYKAVVTAPTCTAKGYTTYTCTRCSDSYKADEREALGHDWDEGKVTTPATETKEGVKTFTCKRCGETKTEKIPATGPVVAPTIDFTKAADADKYEVVNKSSAAVEEGTGVKLIATRPAFEDCNGQNTGDQATNPEDVIVIPVSDYEWEATLKFDFSTGSSANGYYQFFGFYAAEGDDYQNMAGIRGGDGAMQNFTRIDGVINADNNNSEPGLASNGTYWYRIKKTGDSTYTCYRSEDGENFTEMFTYEDTGVEADRIIIDAYTGMTEGYEFTLKSLDIVGAGTKPCEHDYKAVKTESTCTEKGKTVFTCTKCGKSYEEEIAALGHDFKAGDIVAPTCTEKGYTVYKCSRCDATENRDEVAALGHKYEDGKCTECGEADPDYKACPSVIFTDAPAKDNWAHEGIDFCVDKNYMNGVADTVFNPAGNVTRAQLVTILYRIEEEPEVEFKGTFVDVEDGQWYSKAIEWAAANDIVKGVGEGKFKPMGAITREQIATIFFRYAKAEKIEGDLKAFPDYEDAHDYAVDALVWAVQEGIITGVKSGEVTNLKPLNNATRAQIATIIMRYLDGEYKCGK